MFLLYSLTCCIVAWPFIAFLMRLMHWKRYTAFSTQLHCRSGKWNQFLIILRRFFWPLAKYRKEIVCHSRLSLIFVSRYSRLFICYPTFQFWLSFKRQSQILYWIQLFSRGDVGVFLKFLFFEISSGICQIFVRFLAFRCPAPID